MKTQNSNSESKLSHFHFNPKSLLLITMVVFCVGAFGLFQIFDADDNNIIDKSVDNINNIITTVISPQQAQAATVFSNVESIAVKRTTATIQYNTDIPATGQIEYGLTTSYGNLTD